MKERVNALVLGGGRVGSVIASDLTKDPHYHVTLADLEQRQIEGVTCEVHDCARAETITALARRHDIVFGALPSRLGLMALEAVIAAGRDYCDISFMSEDGRVLSEKARQAGVTAVLDFGVAPGMSHLLAAYGEKMLDQPQEVVIYVGGLPKERRWPFEYKAGFAPADVIEEYTRPARFVVNGTEVEREALSEPEPIDFDNVGTLEAFNTDGLRSGLDTLSAPHRIEKTLRYPGHIELMRAMRHTGLFSEEPISVPTADGGEALIRPLDMMSRLLFPHWSFDEGEADLTVMRVTVRGIKDARPHLLRWDLYDEYDPKAGQTSMSRTTGFPCAIVGRLLAEKRFARPGVHPPEALADDDDRVQMILAELEKRKVFFRFSQLH